MTHRTHCFATGAEGAGAHVSARGVGPLLGVHPDGDAGRAALVTFTGGR